MSAGLDYLTTGKVAKLLRISTRTVSAMCDGGKLPAHRIPGSEHRRILLRDLLTFMEKYKYPEPLIHDVRKEMGIVSVDASAVHDRRTPLYFRLERDGNKLIITPNSAVEARILDGYYVKLQQMTDDQNWEGVGTLLGAKIVETAEPAVA